MAANSNSKIDTAHKASDSDSNRSGILIVAALVLSAVLLWTLFLQPWLLPSRRYTRVADGMTAEEVRALLGPPHREWRYNTSDGLFGPGEQMYSILGPDKAFVNWYYEYPIRTLWNTGTAEGPTKSFYIFFGVRNDSSGEQLHVAAKEVGCWDCVY